MMQQVPTRCTPPVTIRSASIFSFSVQSLRTPAHRVGTSPPPPPRPSPFDYQLHHLAAY